MSSVNITNESYSFELKKKLKERIEKLSDREYIEKIKQLIFKYNPLLSYTQNSSGVLLFFHDLTNETYSKLDTYLKKIDSDKVKKITLTMTDEEPNNIRSSNRKNLTDTINQNNIRLSSLEKNIIKKKDYYEKLKEENNVDTDIIYKSDEDDVDIFLNKDVYMSSSIEDTNTNTNTNKITNTKNVNTKNTNTKNTNTKNTNTKNTNTKNVKKPSASKNTKK